MQTIKREVPAFEGFPQELPDFLWGLSFNNEKPWFEAHRAEYERCLHGPVTALAYALLEELGRRFPKEPMQVHISRIYRDARRLRGRGPFNEHMWFSLGLTGQLYDVHPQFCFGIDAQSYNVGLGTWMAGGDMLERWRAGIDANPQRLARIVRQVNKMEGYERMGPTYKRPKGDPGGLLYDWYNARELGVWKTVRFDPDPPGPELLEQLAEEFSRLMPLYRYLMELV